MLVVMSPQTRRACWRQACVLLGVWARFAQPVRAFKRRTGPQASALCWSKWYRRAGQRRERHNCLGVRLLHDNKQQCSLQCEAHSPTPLSTPCCIGTAARHATRLAARPLLVRCAGWSATCCSTLRHRRRRRALPCCAARALALRCAPAGTRAGRTTLQARRARRSPGCVQRVALLFCPGVARRLQRGGERRWPPPAARPAATTTTPRMSRCARRA